MTRIEAYYIGMVIVYFLQEVNNLLFSERDVATNKHSQEPNGTNRVPPVGMRRMTDFQKIPILSLVLDEDTSQNITYSQQSAQLRQGYEHA